MMDDLISRKAAISTATTVCEWCDTGDIIDYRDMMVESLKVLPSAQQWIPVTRCKDCIHRPKGRLRCCVFDMYTADDFFCPEGKGEKNETD